MRKFRSFIFHSIMKVLVFLRFAQENVITTYQCKPIITFGLREDFPSLGSHRFNKGKRMKMIKLLKDYSPWLLWALIAFSLMVAAIYVSNCFGNRGHIYCEVA